MDGSTVVYDARCDRERKTRQGKVRLLTYSTPDRGYAYAELYPNTGVRMCKTPCSHIGFAEKGAPCKSYTSHSQTRKVPHHT